MHLSWTYQSLARRPVHMDRYQPLHFDRPDSL